MTNTLIFLFFLKNVNKSYLHFCSRNINDFEELVKLTMLWTTGVWCVCVCVCGGGGGGGSGPDTETISCDLNCWVCDIYFT